MYQHIMAPVDLAHIKGLSRALDVTADLAARWGAKVTYVGVTSALPGTGGHNPAEFTEHLKAFAADQASRHGIETDAHPAFSHDPSTDLDDTLLKALSDTGADLVVMQSHVPGLIDYIWPSNGGKIAGHAKVSVFVVRG